MRSSARANCWPRSTTSRCWPSLSRYEAQLKLAEDRVYRQSALLEKDAVSQEAYEQARTELAMLNADIDIVKSNIALTELPRAVRRNYRPAQRQRRRLRLAQRRGGQAHEDFAR